MFIKRCLAALSIAAGILAVGAEKEHDIERKKVVDPFKFKFNQNSKGAGYIPSSAESVPSGIKVVGIMEVEKKGFLAALKIDDNSQIYFVKVGDVIRVDQKRVTNKKASVIYLEVLSLSKSEVTIAPKQRPDAQVILR